MRFDSAPRVLITGAAGGVGRVCADMLAQMGAELILCDHDAQLLASASEELGAVGRYCDVSSEASVTSYSRCGAPGVGVSSGQAAGEASEEE